MTIERFMVPGEPLPFSHYCHVVRAGNHIYLSGAVGIAADGSIPTTTAEQFKLALQSLDNCLRHAGGQAEHIVKVNLYMTRIDERTLINQQVENGVFVRMAAFYWCFGGQQS